MFVFVFLIVLIPITISEVDLIDNIESDSKIYKTNLTYSNDTFIFMDSEITLKLTTELQKGDTIYSLDEGVYKEKTYAIEKTTDKYKFSLDLSQIDIKEKTELDKILFKINFPEITLIDNVTDSFRFGPEHSSGMYIMNFSDLVNLGYDVSIYNKTIEISNLKEKDLNLDPIVELSTVNIDGIKLVSLDDDVFVVVYFDDTNDDMSFKIYQTNGTLLVDETDIDTASSGRVNSIGLTALNKTDFVISWDDNPDSDVTFAIYNNEGTLKLGPIDADTSSAGWATSVSAFNSTDFVVCWKDGYGGDSICSVYNSAGTLKLGPTIVFENIGGLQETKVTTLNSTDYVVLTSVVSFKIYNSKGTQKLGRTNINTSTRLAISDIKALNSTDFVISWDDDSPHTNSFVVYDNKGTLKSGPTNFGQYTKSIAVSPLNSTTFAIGWISYFSNVGTRFMIKDYLNNTIKDTTLLSSQDDGTIHITSYNPITDTNICANNFVIAYENSTSSVIFETYLYNGSEWDGICSVGEEPSDTCTPSAIGNNWGINITDNCTISAQVIELGVGNISVYGSNGFLIFSNCNVTTFKLGYLFTDGYVALDGFSKLYVGG